MSNLSLQTPNVSIVNGVPKTTSLDVASLFKKEHKHVLRDIQILDCSEEFRVSNFGHTPYIHPQNRQTYPMYTMTKDGFTFLVMGYTGKEAARFKEAYIKRFNEMEATLNHQAIDLDEELDKFGELYNEVTELRSKISQLFDSTASHLAKLAATREVDRQHTPALESKPRAFNKVIDAIDLIKIITDAIDQDGYDFPYQIKCLNNSPTLTIKLKDVMVFLNKNGIRHSFMATRDIRAQLYADDLIVREPVHFYLPRQPRYMNFTMIDLSKFLGGVQ